jgi:hypothetical protein
MRQSLQIASLTGVEKMPRAKTCFTVEWTG